MNQQQALALGWKRIRGSDCFVTPKGKGRLVTIKEYKSPQSIIKISRVYSKTHRKEQREYSQKRRDSYPEETAEESRKYSKEHYTCKKLAQKLQSRTFRKTNPKSVKKTKEKILKKHQKNGYSYACANAVHKNCSKTKKTCPCKCHKNT